MSLKFKTGYLLRKNIKHDNVTTILLDLKCIFICNKKCKMETPFKRHFEC